MRWPSIFIFIFFAEAFAGILPKKIRYQSLHVEVVTSYGTLKSEIHFQDKEFEFAKRVESVIKQDLARVIDYFHYVPITPVHFMVNSSYKEANGSARHFPSNLIELYTQPPVAPEHLIANEDYVRGLVIHEFTHVIHLDQTRGIWQFSRDIFGSIGKIPVAIVPRWFTEGIATWAESHFTNSGRLHSSMLNYELKLALSQQKHCQDISCIDSPGVYPQGQLAYWVGAHFMQKLEAQKAGTIKCLVEENSDQIPFTLNLVFRDCTGHSVEGLMSQMLLELRQEIEVEQQTREHLRMPVFQMGVVVNPKELYMVESEDGVYYLVKKDRLAQNTLLEKSFQDVIDKVVDFDETKLLIQFREDLTFKQNHYWALVNKTDFKNEETLRFQKDLSYLFKSESVWYGLHFKTSHWQLLKFENLKDEGEVVVDFPIDATIVKARALDQHNWLIKLVSAEKKWLLMFNTEDRSLKEIFSSPGPFDFSLLTDKKILIDSQSEKNILEIKGIKIQLAKVSSEMTQDAVMIEQNVEWPKKSDKWREIKIETDAKSNNEQLMVDYDLAQWAMKAKNQMAGSDTLFDYPQKEHFKPTYWFFNYQTTSDYNQVGASTQISDPKEIYTLGLGFNYFTDFHFFAPTINYSQKYDFLTGKLYYDKSYVESAVNNKADEINVAGLQLMAEYEFTKFTFVPFVGLSQNKTSDAFSNRTNHSFYIGQSLDYQSVVKNHWAQKAGWSFMAGIEDSSVAEGSYSHVFTSADFLTRLFSDLHFLTKFNYGKLGKSDFRRAVLYGGGVEALNQLRQFPFYGLPYGAIYGNEILTTRFEFQYRLFENAWGYGLVPFYLKETYLLYGVDLLAADRVYVKEDHKVYRNESFYSQYWGVRLKTDMFYLAPVNMDLIISKFYAPGGQGHNDFYLNLNASF